MIKEWLNKKFGKNIDDLTKTVGTKLVINTKESVNKQVAKDIKENLPTIIGVAAVGLIILTGIHTRRTKPVTATINIVINNIYGGGRR